VQTLIVCITLFFVHAIDAKFEPPQNTLSPPDAPGWSRAWVGILSRPGTSAQ